LDEAKEGREGTREEKGGRRKKHNRSYHKSLGVLPLPRIQLNHRMKGHQIREKEGGRRKEEGERRRRKRKEGGRRKEKGERRRRRGHTLKASTANSSSPFLVYNSITV
jgi:hypothetical protein